LWVRDDVIIASAHCPVALAHVTASRKLLGICVAEFVRMSWLLSSRGSVTGNGGNLATRVASWMITSHNMSNHAKGVMPAVPSRHRRQYVEHANDVLCTHSPGPPISMIVTIKNGKFVSIIMKRGFRADNNGCVDVSNSESLGGSYNGLFPMGLIGCLKPAPHEYKYTRFFKRDVEKPNIVDVSVYSEHLDDTALYSENVDAPLASLTHQRHYMAPGVQKIPVRYGKVRGSLFLPPGPGPFPGVVDMFGTAGGLLEYRSAQLASRGFASLALAFFAYEDLPKALEEFDLDYFREAVDFLLRHEKIISDGIGVIGTSKGGDLALCMATFIPEIRACVAINGSNACIGANFRAGHELIPSLPYFDISKVRMHDDGIMETISSVPDSRLHPESVIPIERSNSAFLFLVGVDDRDLNSEFLAQEAFRRLKHNNYPNSYEVSSYPGTGHLLEPPYSAHCVASFQHSFMCPILWGGTAKHHCRGQEQAWLKMRHFLWKNLIEDRCTTDQKLQSML
ncbi:unnamed protein product, partial [Meganyctiphanes norvegica]